MSLHGVKFKAYPTASQKLVLSQWMGCARAIYNAKCAEDKYFQTFARKSLSLTGEKAPIDQTYSQFKSDETSWLKECPSQILRNSAVRWYQAYQNFFKKRAGRPRFKRKGGRDTIWLTKELFVLEKIEDKWVLFIGTKTKNIGYLSFYAHRDFVLPASITLSRERGEYFVSFSYEDGLKAIDAWSEVDPLKEQGESVLVELTEGYNRGVVKKIQSSTGESFDLDETAQKKVTQKAKSIKKHQKRLARQKKNSNRSKKTKQKLAKDHAKIVNIHQDYAHKTTHKLVESDRQIFVLEELKTKQMTKSPDPKVDESGNYLFNRARAKAGLNRSILSSCWGKLEVYLGYKAKRKGKLVVLVSPHYTSQECAKCHHIHPHNRPTQCEFSCQLCGHTENADFNASMVIKQRGVQALLEHPKGHWEEKSNGIWKLKKQTPAGTRGSARGEKVRRQRRESMAQSQRSVNRAAA